jgi:DNA-binding response OmpR family regulator
MSEVLGDSREARGERKEEGATTSGAPIPNVLLVEDHQDTASSLADLLRSFGFCVTCAIDGPSALEAARANLIDVVILDIVLPGMNGFEVCRRLKSDPSCRTPIVVMLTGLDDTLSKLRGLSGGADDYIVKPIVSKELIARIRKRLAARDELAHEVRRQRRQAVAAIVTTVAHEINHPLMATRGTIDLLLLGHDLSPNARRELERCQAHIAKIAAVYTRLTTVQDATLRT